MAILDEVIPELKADFESLGIFKRVYPNIAPVWTQVHDTPSISLILSDSQYSRDSLSSNRVRAESTILVYIYNRQPTNEFEDILTELIEETQRIILGNKYLQCNTIEFMCTEVKRDGGTVHPYSIAQIKIALSYVE